MVDQLIRRTAKDLAGAFFNNMDALKDNRFERSARFRSEYQNERDFINEQWPHFVPAARTILTKMLEDKGRSDHDKDKIFDALLRDHNLPTDEDLAAPSIIRPN